MFLLEIKTMLIIRNTLYFKVHILTFQFLKLDIMLMILHILLEHVCEEKFFQLFSPDYFTQQIYAT
jgi:hypothetical protein